MPRKRQPDIVGGFDVFKALERSQQGHVKRRVSRSGADPDPLNSVNTEDFDGKRVASNIGRTAMPPKHRLVCFECSYKFEITGKIEAIDCPRCRVSISLRDVVVDQEWSEDIKTGGAVTVTSDGIVKDCEVIAKDVIFSGRVLGGSIIAYDRLKLNPEGVYDPESIEAKVLEISEGTQLELSDCEFFSELDIYGSLYAADLTVEDLLTIRRAGALSGRATSKRLVVEEGGGLLAEVNICG